MNKYANVIIDITHEKVDKPFSYKIPDELRDSIDIGSPVLVPFGNGNKTRHAYVVGFSDSVDFDESKIKEICAVDEKGTEACSSLIKLAFWMKERYSCTMNQTLKTVLPVKKQVKARPRKKEFDFTDTEVKGEYLTLNEEQKLAADTFASDFRQGIYKTYLLHGITGSGKTEVYMKMADEVIASGRQVIILIPEISLTYQTVERFYRRYGDKIAVMNSKLSAGEKYEQWNRCLSGEVSVIIGPRSALFAPFGKLGLIIIDEEHDEAYKSETAPRYHARQAARKRAEIEGASVVMGSATPSLESYAMAENGYYTLLKLTTRAVAGSVLPDVSVVDMREELKNGNKSIFSQELRQRIEEALQKKEQIMLFMNRRGYSRFVSCRSCGKPVRCPHCDVSLTLHEDGRLQCHYCGYKTPYMKLCPSCGSPYLAGFGVGTEKLETMVKEVWPDARVLRMDADTTARKGSFERILRQFSSHKADILIGTQMIVKGHDFGKVTVMGIMAADLSLNMPDYRSGERTFSLITQAAGRAGRAENPGHVVIQTYQPEHYAVVTAAAQNYEDFFSQEFSYRDMMNYPPATGMLAVMLQDPDEDKLSRVCTKVADSFRNQHEALMIGPVNASIYKVNDMYRKILYFKCGKYDILFRIRKDIELVNQAVSADSPVLLQFDIS